MNIPVAFNGVIIDFGQSIPSPHHYLVKFWVPQASDDALETTRCSYMLCLFRCVAGDG